MMDTSTKRELAALSRIFSPAVVREIGRTGRSALLARLLDESGVAAVLPRDATLADAFEVAFARLRNLGNRDDYVYRSAITQKIALGRHNLRSATVLNEMRARSSKADVVILNGTATAYEIKSERDSFQRLPSQLADYLSVFASVNVVTSPAQSEVALRIVPSEVGIIVLTHRHHLHVVREAIDAPARTSPLAILQSLRVEEANDVLGRLGIDAPRLPNTKIWAALHDIFESLDAGAAQSAMVAVLKKSRSRAGFEPFIKQLPSPLAAAVLSTNLSKTARINLSVATKQPLSAVLAWI